MKQATTIKTGSGNKPETTSSLISMTKEEVEGAKDVVTSMILVNLVLALCIV